MRVFWRVLVGLILTLTPAAYVAGELVGPPQMAAPETPPTGTAQSPAAGVPHPAARRALLVAHTSGSTADRPAPSPASVVVSRPRPPVAPAPQPAPSAAVSAGALGTDPVSPSPATPSGTTASDLPSPQPPTDTATAEPSGEGSPTAGDTWSPSSGPTDSARSRADQWDGGW